MGGLERLEIQAAIFEIVNAEWCVRAGRVSHGESVVGDANGVGAAVHAHVVSLATPDLEELRLRLASALLRETDLRIATGEVVARNEEMA